MRFNGALEGTDPNNLEGLSAVATGADAAYYAQRQPRKANGER